LTQKKKDKS